MLVAKTSTEQVWARLVYPWSPRANFTDFEPEINIIKRKTEKLKQKT